MKNKIIQINNRIKTTDISFAHDRYSAVLIIGNRRYTALQPKNYLICSVFNNLACIITHCISNIILC